MSAQRFLAELISENDYQRLRDIWDDATTRRKRRVTSIECPRCRSMKKLDIEVDTYELKDVNTFLRMALEFGVGKPAEKKQVDVNVRALHAIADLEKLSDAELLEIAEGPELEPAA